MGCFTLASLAFFLRTTADAAVESFEGSGDGGFVSWSPIRWEKCAAPLRTNWVASWTRTSTGTAEKSLGTAAACGDRLGKGAAWLGMAALLEMTSSPDRQWICWRCPGKTARLRERPLVAVWTYPGGAASELIAGEKQGGGCCWASSGLRKTRRWPRRLNEGSTSRRSSCGRVARLARGLASAGIWDRRGLRTTVASGAEGIDDDGG
ncbi:hypothetical protein Droror1_Dr00021790 [Drosera rotundifolia]